VTADSWVVRVRVARMCWTSTVMTGREAEDYREGLRAQVLAAGDGAGMVDFRALGGRQVAVRARDVVAVETAPWTEREISTGGFQASEDPGVAVNSRCERSGTAFLRRVSGLDGSMARHPAGSRAPVVR
jgi:hypothetical protein